MPTTQTSIETVDEVMHPKGRITIEKTPNTRFGCLYFPKFEPKENDKKLGDYTVKAFRTIDEAKKYGLTIADAYLKQQAKKKRRSLER